MKPLLLSALAALSIAAVAAPAFAQPYGGGGAPVGGSIVERESRIDARIDQGMHNGGLTRREGFRLRRELRDIEDVEHQYRRADRGHLTDRHRADLEGRLDQLSSRVFGERHDDDRRGDHHEDHHGY